MGFKRKITVKCDRGSLMGQVKGKGDKIDVKIVIATHKEYPMPQDSIYIPLHVGAEGKDLLEYQGDNIGENISTMNPYFCELTGLYWMWKNLKADYLGLAHYRRHFCSRKKGDKWKSILNSNEAQMLCKQYDVVLPNKRHYVIESLESHYSHTHYKEHLDKTRIIVENRYPQYLESYDNILRKTSGYMFNMFLMRQDLLEDYCTFLFDVLFELNQQVDISNYTPFQSRYPGRVGEILFNVWLIKKSEEQNLKVKEIKHIHMESINWWDKGNAFLQAKFLKKRYEHGF